MMMMNMKMKEKTMQCQGHQREQDPGKKHKKGREGLVHPKPTLEKQHQSHMTDQMKPEASENYQTQFQFASLSLICLNTDYCQTPLQLQLVGVGVDFVFPCHKKKKEPTPIFYVSEGMTLLSCGCLKCVWKIPGGCLVDVWQGQNFFFLAGNPAILG